MLIDFIFIRQISNVFSVFCWLQILMLSYCALILKVFRLVIVYLIDFILKQQISNVFSIFHLLQILTVSYCALILKAFRLVIGLYHNRFNFKSTNFKYIFCFLFVTDFNSIILCCNTKCFQTSNSIL